MSWELKGFSVRFRRYRRQALKAEELLAAAKQAEPFGWLVIAQLREDYGDTVADDFQKVNAQWQEALNRRDAAGILTSMRLGHVQLLRLVGAHQAGLKSDGGSRGMDSPESVAATLTSLEQRRLMAIEQPAIDMSPGLAPFPGNLLRIYEADRRIVDVLRTCNLEHRRAVGRGDTQGQLVALAKSARTAVALLAAELVSAAEDGSLAGQRHGGEIEPLGSTTTRALLVSGLLEDDETDAAGTR